MQIDERQGVVQGAELDGETVDRPGQKHPKREPQPALGRKAGGASAQGRSRALNNVCGLHAGSVLIWDSLVQRKKVASARVDGPYRDAERTVGILRKGVLEIRTRATNLRIDALVTRYLPNKKSSIEVEAALWRRCISAVMFGEPIDVACEAS